MHGTRLLIVIVTKYYWHRAIGKYAFPAKIIYGNYIFEQIVHKEINVFEICRDWTFICFVLLVARLESP